MNPLSVLLRPIQSEKSGIARESNKYTFVVSQRATKDDVKKAVKSLFDVEAVAVNTMIRPGKMKRRGMHVGFTSKTKHAIVSLKEGQTIKLFEDQ